MGRATPRLVGFSLIPLILMHMGARGDEEPSAAQDEILLARIAAGQGKYEEALKHATRAIELDSKNAESLLLRGQLYAARRKHEQAIADLDAVVKLDPKNGAAYDKRGERR